MMDVELVAAAAIYLYTAYKYLTVYQRHAIAKKRTRKRRCWMQAIHQERTRVSMNNRLAELLTEPTGQYFIHMSSSDLEYLLLKISPIIKKQDTHWRDSIPAKIRLAVTLRFLATGDSYSSLHRFFKISSSLVSRIIPEVCRAFNVVLRDMMRMPQSREEWLSKTKKFSLPHCLGALDGRHVPIWAPSHTGPEDLNYQGSYSMVLLTLVDGDYSFMYSDIVLSQNTDYEVYNQSELWHKMSTDTLNLPSNTPFPGARYGIPYVFVNNGVFPLSDHMMRPLPGRYPPNTPESIFNKLLIQSHAAVDNAYGVLSSVFKVLLKPLTLEPAKCSAIIQSCLLLHNFLIKSDTSKSIYTPPGSVDTYGDGELVCQGSWRHENQDHLLPIQPRPSMPEDGAIQMRLDYLNFVYKNTIGSF